MTRLLHLRKLQLFLAFVCTSTSTYYITVAYCILLMQWRDYGEDDLNAIVQMFLLYDKK